MGWKSSTSEDPRKDPLPTVVVGRIRRPHGLRGEVLVEILSDTPGRFSAGSRLLLVAPGVRRRVEVGGSRHHNRGTLVRFRDFDDRDAVGGLNGATLEVEESQVPPSEEGTFYHFELMGCRCRDRRVGDLGEVVDVIEDGGGLLLMVRKDGREVAVPFVRDFVVEVDRDGQAIELDLPEGLVEICASRF